MSHLIFIFQKIISDIYTKRAKILRTFENYFGKVFSTKRDNKAPKAFENKTKPRSCLLTLFYSFAYSCLNYCITTWCNNNLAFWKVLPWCCNKILRLIFFRNYILVSNCYDIYKKHECLKIQDMLA